jgi:hypothetical protein
MQTSFMALFNNNALILWSFIALSTFGTTIVLFLLKHRDQAAADRDWNRPPSNKGH